MMIETTKNCYSFSVGLNICDLEDYTLVTIVLLNLDRFYNIMATIHVVQYFRSRKSAIMEHFVTFRNGSMNVK